ncbi:SCAN domain-containing protein [Ooceraea biroi]|uniref:SCAN domain-containing protein n=1 Tax=Ooceraea biroi TaxID=2015173 RepID=A0A026WKH1_OOCBI|nr:SCAN domain-containing protein [Ooceraea biroi]
MAQDVEVSLCDFLKTTQFSLQLDESIVTGNEALLLAYVRFIKEEKICQELLFAKQLIISTKGESIFNVVKAFFKEREIPLNNIISIAIDGALAMVGRYRGFISFFKKSVPNVCAVHCVIHRQHLVAKNLSDRLHCSLQYVITAVNKIHALKDRLFRQICIENDEDFNRLLFHTEVHWLLNSACLNRVYNHFDLVIKSFENKDNLLRNNLIKVKSDIAYLTDLYNKFNKMNLELQGDELNLIKTKSIISAFMSKLLLYKRKLERGVFYQFLNLSSVKKRDDEVLIYCQHLQALHNDFNNRFEDILTMKIPAWILDPFSSTEETELQLQEELIELSTNEELKFKFKNGYQAFWLQKQIPTLYPQLWAVVKKFLIAFPSSYLVERGCSAVASLFLKQRNLLQIADRGDLRILLTNIKPNIDKLIAAHQAHPSH